MCTFCNLTQRYSNRRQTLNALSTTEQLTRTILLNTQQQSSEDQRPENQSETSSES